MKKAQPLNPGVFRLHQFCCLLAAAATAVWLWFTVKTLAIGQPLMTSGWGYAVILFLPIALLHGFAAKGARDGRPYGRILSRIVAAWWLFAFPIGTALAIFLWKWTQPRRWQIGRT